MKTISVYIYYQQHTYGENAKVFGKKVGEVVEDTAVFLTREAAEEYAGRYEKVWNGSSFTSSYTKYIQGPIKITINEEQGKLK